MALLAEPDEDRRSGGPRRGVVALVAVAVVLVSGATAWRLSRHAPVQPARRSGHTATPGSRQKPVPGAATGIVQIDAEPAGALVTVDGQDLGEAPQSVELHGGSHAVRVRKEGFEPFARDVHVIPGRTLEVSARLTREAPRLRVDADVPGATVFLDRKPFGQTPLAPRPITPGAHRLNVTAEGYEMYSQTIEATTGTYEVVARFKEVRLDEALDVVHKHPIGSCRGRLLADVGGLRYETSDSQDAFHAPFSALEPLRMDYPGKTLRVKVKGGRTYNFTGTSADALLAFEQAVTAARKRL